MHQTKAWWPWATTLLLSFVGCSSDSASNGSVAGKSPATTSAAIPRALTAEQRRVLGFEDPGSSDWVSDVGTLSRSAVFHEGTSALSLQLPGGRTEVCSSKLALPLKRGDSISFQLWMHEPTPSFGEVQVVLRPAAQGAAQVELAPVAIKDKSEGVLHTIASPLGGQSPVEADDAPSRVCIIIDAEPGRYVLDDLRLSGPAPDDDSNAATRRVGRPPISRAATSFSAADSGWPNLTDQAPDSAPDDAFLAGPTADEQPLWSDAGTPVDDVPSSEPAKTADGKAEETREPRVALFELDDPDFCTTETLLPTAPFVSGITPLPNGTTIPYPLCTAQQFATLIATSSLWSKNFVLMGDIDLSAPPAINPTGVQFTGVFDGNNHTLSNFAIQTTSHVGLFGKIGPSGVVRNLVLRDFVVRGIGRVGALSHDNDGLIDHVTGINLVVSGDSSSTQGVGGLLGRNGGTVSDSSASVNMVARPAANNVGGLVGFQPNGQIVDCTVSGSMTRPGAGAAQTMGGAVGRVNGGVIINTHSSVNVSSSTGEVGGLAGVVAAASVIECSSSGIVSVPSAGSVGGLVGYNYGSVDSSWSNSTVSGAAGVGGLVGRGGPNSTIVDSSAQGNVHGTVNYTGGLVGQTKGAITTSWASGAVEGNDYVGGLTGQALFATSSIDRSWASGHTSATGSHVGGLVGNLDGQVDASFARGDVSGDRYVGGLVGMVELGGSIQDSSATGNTVTGDQTIGGLVGSLAGIAERCSATAAVTANTGAGGLAGGLLGSAIDSYATGAVTAQVGKAGGLVAYLGADASIVRAYAAGPVSGIAQTGAFVGEALGGSLEDCHFNATRNPGLTAVGTNPSATGVAANSDDALRQVETFAEWEFPEVWGILEGYSYPFLQPIPSCAEDGCSLGCPCPADTCTTESDCAFGQTCGESNGGYFDEDPDTNVCWDPLCGTDQRDELCSAPGAPCGSCSGLGCDEGGCGPACPCDSGEGTCDSDSDCEAPAVCIEGNGPQYGHGPEVRVCQDPLCITMAAFVGCGYEGAPCGDTCSRQVPCSAGCPAGYVCGVNKGPLFGDVVADVCWPAECAVDPVEAGCGTLLSKCGVCECQPGCAGKTCGDDPYDGCGGFCTGLCEPREPGCTQDTDCPGGFGCLVDGGPRVGEPAGMNVCLAVGCLGPDLQVPACGSVAAECGLCPAACEPECDGRECGLDRKCGAPCGGDCDAGEFCTANGQCESSASDNDAPITVDDGMGGTRDIEPLDSPTANEVGATPGTFAVDALGNATYSIPIAVPPGRAGVEPQLAVQYSSATGNDLLGIGWSLGGLSAISRCSRSLARDGAPGAVRYDATDVYCLDGQRLAPLPGANNEFRTDIDSFSKIVSYGAGGTGPTSFKVWTRDGRILSYGGAPNSRSYFAADLEGVRVWALDRIEDRARNRIDVQYRKEDQDGVTLEMVPERFWYGGNETLAHDRSVRFEYEKRPTDMMEGFTPGGAPFVRSLRLQRIDTLVKDVVTRSYNLQYDPQVPNGVSRLKTLHECLPPASNPKCKPPTQFAYHWESPELDQGQAFSTAPLLPSIVFDPDGDGDHDLKASGLWYNGGYHELLGKWTKFGVKITANVVLTYYGGGWAGPVANEAIDWFSAEWGDDEYKYIPPALYEATGDRSDPIRVEAPPEDNICIDEGQSLPSGAKPLRGAVDVEGDGTDEVRVLCNWRSEEECFILDESYIDRRRFYAGVIPQPYPEWMADLNGDALADHIRCEPTLEGDGDGSLSFALRDPASSQLGSYTTISVPRAFCLPACAQSAEGTPTLVLDVDGDGAENLVFFDGGWQGRFGGQPATGWQALVFADGVLELVPVPGIPAPSTTHDILVADINGDGLQDVVKLTNLDNVNDEPVAVSLNTSRGFIPRTFDQADGFRAVAGTHRSWVHDYDRDGRDDILHPQVVGDDGGGYWVRIRLAGDGHRELLTTKLNEPEYPFPYVTADIDGDGNMDILGATGGTSLRIYYGRGNKNNLLTAVHDGADRRVDIEYTFETFEDSECVSEWPNQCLPKSPRPLVDRYSEAHAPLSYNPLSGPALYPELAHDYAYYSPRVGLAGHGWQGFSKVIIQDFRCEVGCYTLDDGVRTNLTELFYEPVTPVQVDGGVVYPLAGKLRESVSRTIPTRSEIEDPATQGLYDQERSQFEWEVATSADGRPFPHLRHIYSTTSVSTYDPDAGDLVSSTTTTRDVDGYGNVYQEETTSWPYNDTQHTTFWPPDRDNWLISLPERVTVTSTYNELPTKTRITDYTYDDGLVATITVQPDDLQLKLVTTLFRDELNNVDHITYADTAGNLREQFFEYDDSGIFPLLSYDGRLHATQFRYDERHGEVTLMVDPNGIETKLAYDGFARLREVIAPEGRATFDFANSDGGLGLDGVRTSYKIIRTTNGFADSETDIDAFGRVGRTITHGYDGQTVYSENLYKGGLLFRSTRPHLLPDQSQGYTEYAYDAADRLIHVRHPDSRSEQRLYANSASLAEEHWDWMSTSDPTYIVASVAPNGERDVLVTDQRGNPRTSVDAIGNHTEYLPDAFNGLYRIIDSEQNETYVVSDAFNRTTFLRDPARGDNYFEYSAFGETIGHSDGNGELHQYFYDEVGRLEGIEDIDGATLFAYDGTGPNEIDRLVSATSPDGHVTAFAYQPPETGRNRGLLENIHRTVQGETFTETVEYDELSRVVAHHYPASAGSDFGVSYHYNAEHGYLEAIRDAATTTTAYWRYISSYQGYRIESDGQGGATHTDRTFDPLTGQLQRIQTIAQPLLTPAAVIHDVSYTYDDNYNLRTRTDELGDRGTDTFFNDRLDRLDFFNRDRPGAATETFDYGHDTIGNLTYQTNVGPYDYSDPDADEGYLLRSAGTTIYSYDGNGAMISRLGALVHNSNQAVYLNAAGLPKSIEMPAAEQTVDFEYSAFGERAAKLSPADASGVTLYAGDGYRREQPDPSVDNYLHHYRVFAGGRQVAQVTRAETDGTITNEWTQYLHHDLLGSVEVISEGGAVVHDQQFDPYGSSDNPQWSLTGILSGFTGHEDDPDLGLINMKGRLFDSTIGRFISADPYVQSPLWGQGLNRYSYGYNNPMSGSDPTGYGWLEKVFGDSTGWEGTAAFGGFGILVVSGAYLGTGGLGGSVGIAHATYGLTDPGANATYAAPTGELGSGAGLYNEGARAPASGPDARRADNDFHPYTYTEEHGRRIKTPREAFGADIVLLPMWGDVIRSTQWAWSWAFGSARSARTIAMTTEQAAAVLRTPPQGYRTMAQFGERLGWGGGSDALKTALARTQSLTVGEAQGLGISSNKAFLIRDAYRAVLNSAKGMANGVTTNEAALGREVLMHKLGLVLEAAGL